MLKRITLAVLAAASLTANAEMVTLEGKDFNFIYDNSTLFGEATVTGNSFYFLPTGFKAAALNGDTQLTSEVLSVQIVAKAGSSAQVKTIKLTEKGDYVLANNGSVRANARLEIFSTTQQLSSDVVSANTGLLSGDTGLGNVEWNLNLNHNLSWGADSGVRFTLENDLLAQALNQGDYAMIAKKSAQFVVTVNEVPVPAAAWLFGSALVGLVGLKRKK